MQLFECVFMGLLLPHKSFVLLHYTLLHGKMVGKSDFLNLFFHLIWWGRSTG